MCSFIPHELGEAAGVGGYRYLPSGGTESQQRGSRWLKPEACPFCKVGLGSFPPQDWPRPDILAAASPCDQMRRSWEHYARDWGVEVLPLHIPRHGFKPHLIEFYAAELGRLGDALASRAGRIDWKSHLADLREIRKPLYQNLQAWDNLRGRDNTPLTGKEVLSIALTASQLDTDLLQSFCTDVEKIIQNRLSKDKTDNPYQHQHQNLLRVLVLGSPWTEGDLPLFDLIESDNVKVVADWFCTGMRSLPVGGEDRDPLISLAQGLLRSNLCPAFQPNDHFYAGLKKLAQERRVDAVLFLTLKFCHIWGFETTRMRAELGLPLLHLDRDYSDSYEAQWRTRWEAFIERLFLQRWGTLP
ncbi:MAG: 2-hydroxyacyl-CoA dehydratase family protein [Calditrichota bacterium]